MAILKHIKSRNANYSNAIDYLLFQHDESTGKKIKGSNLNQIAKYFNTGGTHSQAMENEIHQCISDLFLLRKKVLEMAGDFHPDTKTHQT